MRSAIIRPTAKERAYPNVISAAGLNSRILPVSSVTTIGSSDDSTTAALVISLTRSASDCRASSISRSFCSVWSRPTKKKPSTLPSPDL